jgi:putative colanic acid biosynthesis UDP-glucose lipid carrier transferase
VDVAGFFDDRALDRTELTDPQKLLGRMDGITEYVNSNSIDLVYITLPMASQPRTLALLDALRDTTASVYIVPDIFVSDLIQARVDHIHGMPVVALTESPTLGVSGIGKRISDIVIASLILLMIWPLLLALAVGVKLSSPGPVIFKQRRYGLDGHEILIYKFRSMSVCDDGDVIKQAGRCDARITRFGAFIRRTSLDELPQFINVLQGRMSVVGPRPHAVAHNEQYRKLIKGYMLRHKVKPGITGWAQVNGLRGETETLDKMRARVQYDIDYMRNWSLGFDLMIIVKTLVVVWRDQNAY